MLSAAVFVGVFLVVPVAAAAQAPCTTDARRVVDEIYRHMLERAPDPGSAGHVERLASSDATVRDLDANADGRVDRDEWHGSVAAFNALDRNDDNGLSRAELHADAGGTDRFAALDINRNGVISRDEWHWSRRSFDQRDANRNGALTRREFDGLP